MNQLKSIIQSKARVISVLSEHRSFVIIFSLLLLVMTFPAILFVFRTDAFYLPTGDSFDIFIHIWDVWYWNQILAGFADRSFTDLLFYPPGLSLVHHPFSSMPINTLQIALQHFLPVSNAFNLVFLLVVFFNAISSYVYALWLFKDKRIALIAAAVFGFSPHILGQPNQLHDATLVTLPLAIYCFHRGIVEKRSPLMIAAGLLTGLTSTITLYSFSCLLISLAAGVIALAHGRLRDLRYWANIGLLAFTIAISSVWIIYPMMADSQALGSALEYHSGELRNDLISSFVNHGNPFLGPLLESILQTPADINLSTTSYIGFVPLLLICLGLASRATNRKMLPWLALAAVFFVLRLGSTLHVNGFVFDQALLPKHYLNELLPSVFKAFSATHRFQIGLLLPLSVLAGYGFIALRATRPLFARSWVVLPLIGLVALEYYVPVEEKSFPFDRFAYIEWLDQVEEVEVRLIHLPMGRINSKQYMLFQSLSGYPHAEGAISRTPDSAYDYIRANPVLNVWHSLKPSNCEITNQALYSAGIKQLLDDGFSHVVHHYDRYHWERYMESFRYVDPAYKDEHVSIYRLTDLRDSCPGDFLARHPIALAYAQALQQPSVIDERHGTIVLFPPTPEAAEQIDMYARHFALTDRAIVTAATGEQGIIAVQSSDFSAGDSSFDPRSEAAVWLLKNIAQFDAEQTVAYQEWFAPRFNFCARYQEDANSTIDLYIRNDIPCSAMDDSAALEVQYVDGLRLHNALFEMVPDKLRFYLAWTNDTSAEYGFSLQFYDEAGQKALQYDNVVGRDLLTVHKVDSAPLAQGVYTVRLVVYNFETGKSQSGILAGSGQRFDRELDIARIEI